MALLTIQELSDKTGVATKNISVYKTRKKVVCDKKGMFDDKHPTNIAFILKHGSKSGVAAHPQVKYVSPARDPDEPDIDDDGLMSLEESEKQYQHYRAVRNQKAVEIADIEIAKKKGVVVPSEFIKPLFRQHNQSILTEVSNMMADQLRTLAKLYGIGQDKVSEVKGTWISQLNEAMERAKKSTAKGIVGIVENFTEAK